MATLFIALEAGITIGAFASAFTYDNHFENFTFVFLAIAALNVGALVYLFFGVKKLGEPVVK